jgi:hypothetical protein
VKKEGLSGTCFIRYMNYLLFKLEKNKKIDLLRPMHTFLHSTLGVQGAEPPAQG